MYDKCYSQPQCQFILCRRCTRNCKAWVLWFNKIATQRRSPGLFWGWGSVNRRKRRNVIYNIPPFTKRGIATCLSCFLSIQEAPLLPLAFGHSSLSCWLWRKYLREELCLHGFCVSKFQHITMPFKAYNSWDKSKASSSTNLRVINCGYVHINMFLF